MAEGIRAAQATLWRDGIAHEGPDSDALTGTLRERNGQGVHFSGAGLREHGAKWAEKIIPWLDHRGRWLAGSYHAVFRSEIPHTKFEFMASGISSMGSVPHTFRLERDVLSKGPIDLLFIEAAVNDSSNIPDHPEQMLRDMEVVVRHVREANPLIDIVHLNFIMPPRMATYRSI